MTTPTPITVGSRWEGVDGVRGRGPRRTVIVNGIQATAGGKESGRYEDDVLFTFDDNRKQSSTTLTAFRRTYVPLVTPDDPG